MIRDLYHAKAVHARRRKAGCRGTGKAVRRWLKRAAVDPETAAIDWEEYREIKRLVRKQ